MAVVATETVVGSHVLTIDGYTKTMAALAVGESIRSEPFRVGGQSWRIVCYPRGGDEELAADGWVSVSLWLWHHGGSHEVKASPRFVLLDRAGEVLHSDGSAVQQTFSMTTAAGRGAWDIDRFVTRAELEAHLVVHDDDCFRIRCDVAVVREPEPEPELQRRNLGDILLETEVGRDVTFVLGGEQVFMAHSCVLAARSSPVFMAEVLAVVVGAGGGSRHVPVDGMAPTVFKALLHFIYTDSLPDELAADDGGDEIAAVQGLLAAADRYGMARLALACSELLLATDVGRDVTFVVSGLGGGGELLTAHMCVLAALSSPAFMAEVIGTGKKDSAAAGGSRHVRVDGVGWRAFRALLHFVYTDTVNDHGTARDLLVVADRYGMERLKMLCSDILCTAASIRPWLWTR